MAEFWRLTVKVIGADSAGPGVQSGMEGLHAKEMQVTVGEGEHAWACCFQGAGSIRALQGPRWRCASCHLAKDRQGDWSWLAPACSWDYTCHAVPVNYCRLSEGWAVLYTTYRKQM